MSSTDEPDVKKQRTHNELTDQLATHLGTDDVEILKINPNHGGIVMTGSFTSKVECQSIQQVRHRIERDDELNIGKNEKFHLYPAFKEALLRLLEKIEEALTDENSPVRIILVHGLPHIGKTSLAECLSYFLALSAGEKETVRYIGLSHSSKTDNDVMTRFITIAGNNKYLIVDQVNTNALKCSEMIESVENRLTVGKIRMPLILFTSGHYAPGEEWLNLQNTGFLCYKLIRMRIDATVVSCLRESKALPQVVAISNDELLKVTTCYSHVKQCLNHLRFNDAIAGKDALRDAIYPGADLRLIGTKSAIHFVWVAWQDLLTKGLPPLDQFSKDDCKLNPHHLEYLGYLINGIKDTKDRGINAILNLMDITGNKQYERNGYSEFKSDSYQYKFLSKKRLYDVLSCAAKTDVDISRDEKYQMILLAFAQLTEEGDTQYQYLRGELFELIITITCETEQERMGYPVGMALHPAGLGFIRVSHSETIATEIELCSLPNKYQMAKENSMSFWCVLNVPWECPFKDFDFAYMETKPIEDKPVLEKLQLFQVTVNPEGKTLDAKLNMTDAINNITAELVKLKLTKYSEAHQVIVPYFVHPSYKNKQIVLPFRNSQRSIKVSVVGFPQALLRQQRK